MQEYEQHLIGLRTGNQQSTRFHPYGKHKKARGRGRGAYKKGLLADTTPKYHPHNISCHHSFIPSSREGDFSVATGVGKATEVRARMLEVYKPNNNNLNNDSLESPPLPTILVYIFNPFRAYLGYQQTTHPTRRADSENQVLSRKKGQRL